MHIERVEAHGFGPLQDAVLELGPGCNVVHGPNESGKSSWHAAITTALSGRRRGRGQTTVEREFAEQHRPWTGERWAVGARVHLADGRVVSILQDLDDPARCQAYDQTGRPVLDEILGDGMPDASRWLGLDRDAFRACASVGQADVARLEGHADALQQYLQQAASTRRAESTAGAALGRLRSFKAEAVGADRKNSVKPLRQASERLVDAERSHAEAGAAHACLIDSTEACTHLVGEAERAAAVRRAAEAVEAERAAAELDGRVERITDLTERCPEPPASPDQDDDQVRAIAEALTRWEQRPEAPVPPTPSAADIRARLAERLPSFGDTEPHPSVTDAVEAAKGARGAFDFHCDHEPEQPDLPAGTDAVELRELARRLKAEPPPAPPSVAPSIPPSVPFLLAGAGVVAAGALALAGQYLAAVIALTVGTALALALGSRAAGPPPTTRAPESPVRTRIADLGLDPDAGALELLAERAARHEAWAEEGRGLRDEAQRTSAAAMQSIEKRLGTAASPATAFKELHAGYAASCRQAAEQERSATLERGRLEIALAQAVAAEERADQAAEAGIAASEVLRHAATSVGVTAADDEAIAAGLRTWQQARRARLTEAGARHQAWDELQQVRGERSLAEWVAARDEALARRRELAAGIEPDLLARVRGETAPLADLIAAERAAARQAHEARAALEVRQTSVASVAEAAEAVASAEAELDRVRGLDDVLTTTISCLEQAQDRLYRSLAPVLAEQLSGALPAITAGRYQDVTVDPETLQVGVRLTDGSLHSAGLLSHGTAEQIYLLLRVAMAERLVLGGERSPLLLDDVTVHCDPDRTQAILDLLAQVGEERQVVLFTQEPDVVAWAERTLTGDRHRVIALARPAVPA